MVSNVVEYEERPLHSARRRLLVTQQSVHIGAEYSFHKRVLNIFSKKIMGSCPSGAPIVSWGDSCHT